MIIFTNHALLKLQQRGIPKTTVIKTLKFPDYKIPSYSGRLIAYKKFDKLYLKVVYKKEKGNIIVITQHWEEKPKLIK